MIQKIEYDQGTVHIMSVFGKDDIALYSESKGTLLDVIQSLELAGVAEDKDFDDLSIKEDPNGHYRLIIDRPTFCMWLGFEVLNY